MAIVKYHESLRLRGRWNNVKNENLYKNYGKFRAVNNLNLQVPDGRIFGFVGPNGAGKTTTMKIICGLLVQLREEYLLMILT